MHTDVARSSDHDGNELTSKVSDDQELIEIKVYVCVLAT